MERLKKQGRSPTRGTRSRMQDGSSSDESKVNPKNIIKAHLRAGSSMMHYKLEELHALLDLAKEAFNRQPTLVEVKTPVNICGDIHGQYGDLMRVFASCGLPFKVRYLFLGDYVDRGRHQLEVIVLLLACKIQFPTSIYLLRGNHELLHINRAYGFWAEVSRRFTPASDAEALFEHFNEVFDVMPLAAIVANRILCMHGGLSPFLHSLDDIRNIQRPMRTVQGLARDLLWADPERGVTGFQKNEVRGVSFVFGETTVKKKVTALGIDMVIRAHQVVEFGYAFFASRLLCTVFSAARYHAELCNYAAVVVIDRQLELSFVQLKPSEYALRKEVFQQTQESQDATGDEESEH